MPILHSSLRQTHTMNATRLALPLLFASAAWLAGCAAPLPPKPDLPAAPDAFSRAGAASSPAPTTPADGAWWTAFADPVLDRAIATPRENG